MARAESALFPKFVTLFGISLFFLGQILQNLSADKTIFQPSEPIKIQLTWPTKIKIPEIGLSLPVKPGGVSLGNWILSYDSAHYLVTSGLPGEGFNTIIYAHRLPGLFGNLGQIAVGDKIILETDLGKPFIYTVYERQVIDPAQTTKLQTHRRNVVTLFTCDGWFDVSRLMIRGEMVDSIKNALPSFSYQDPKSAPEGILARFLFDPR